MGFDKKERALWQLYGKEFIIAQKKAERNKLRSAE